MSYQLKIDEMMEALNASDHPQAAQIQKRLEDMANDMAMALASHLDIVAGTGDFQGIGFAGTCVPFYAKFEGQELPDVLSSLAMEDEDEWCTREGREAEIARVVDRVTTEPDPLFDAAFDEALAKVEVAEPDAEPEA